jgi:arsenate reductase
VESSASLIGGFHDAQIQSEGLLMKKRVLILCTGNSARSQMAEGTLRRDGGGAFEVESAGVKPSRLRSEAVQVMREIGIDISAHRSKSVEEFIGREFDIAITVCDNAKETCPVFPGKTARVHQSVEDPPPPGVGSDEERLSIFRRVRNEISEWMKDFIAGQSARNDEKASA